MIKRKNSRIMCLEFSPPPKRWQQSFLLLISSLSSKEVATNDRMMCVMKCQKTFPATISIFLQLTLAIATLFPVFIFMLVMFLKKWHLFLSCILLCFFLLLLMGLCGLLYFLVLKFQLVSRTSDMMKIFG